MRAYGRIFRLRLSTLIVTVSHSGILFTCRVQHRSLAGKGESEFRVIVVIVAAVLDDALRSLE